jgi:flagellar protein FlgJ|tara:strand:- start:4656 stop:5102 length:447 start_codon:yes stop_codon:yes gene_type:complete
MKTVDSTTSALGFAELAQLKSDAAQDAKGKIKEVAQQFESIFVNMMLQSMRKATERSGLMDSNASQQYESMFDQELSLHLSKSGGFGVADALERQLEQFYGREQSDPTKVRQLNPVDESLPLSRKAKNYEVMQPGTKALDLPRLELKL